MCEFTDLVLDCWYLTNLLCITKALKKHFTFAKRIDNLETNNTHQKGTQNVVFLFQLTFSQGFSLWLENVENDGSITPDKAISR